MTHLRAPVVVAVRFDKTHTFKLMNRPLCLKHTISLPTQLRFIEWLKANLSFQGAKYEIAIAASIVRAGCDIQWIDHKASEKGQKTCELIATHKAIFCSVLSLMRTASVLRRL